MFILFFYLQFMAFFTPLPVDEEVESVQTELRMQTLCEELRLMLLGTAFLVPAWGGDEHSH